MFNVDSSTESYSPRRWEGWYGIWWTCRAVLSKCSLLHTVCMETASLASGYDAVLQVPESFRFEKISKVKSDCQPSLQSGQIIWRIWRRGQSRWCLGRYRCAFLTQMLMVWTVMPQKELVYGLWEQQTPRERWAVLLLQVLLVLAQDRNKSSGSPTWPSSFCSFLSFKSLYWPISW